MRQMHASVCIDLPADEFDEAEAKLKVKPLWDAFLVGLLDADIVCASRLETLETRAKPATTGAKRGRKPRLGRPPAIVPSTGMFSEPGDGEAA